MGNRVKFAQTSFKVGDLVKVHIKVVEEEKKVGKTKRGEKIEKKERTQIFEGMVIAIRGREENKNFIVRRIGAAKVAIERIFPLSSPWLEKIEVKKPGQVRRAKLYYLRNN